MITFCISNDKKKFTKPIKQAETISIKKIIKT